MNARCASWQLCRTTVLSSQRQRDRSKQQTPKKMGCISSKQEEDDVDRLLREDRQQQDRAHCKVLLLGCGESGKATLFRHINLLHRGPPSDTEVAQWNEWIKDTNLPSWSSLIVEQSKVLEESHPECSFRLPQTLALRDSPNPDVLNPELVAAIKTLLADPATPAIIDPRNRMAVSDFERTRYLLQRAEALSKGETPNDLDLLSLRCRTTGVVETHFTLG